MAEDVTVTVEPSGESVEVLASGTPGPAGGPGPAGDPGPQGDPGPPGEDGIGVPDPSLEPDDRWMRTLNGALVYVGPPVPNPSAVADGRWLRTEGGAYVLSDPPEAGAFTRDEANARIVPSDIGDGWVVGSDQFEEFQADPLNPVNDYRVFFDKLNGSFRAGGTRDNDGWTSTKRGTASHAEGFNTEASGSSSHAEGGGSIASGTSSHAEGDRAEALGGSSHAEGQVTTASGLRSHAEGYLARASGDESHAEGYSTTASGLRSHAEGWSSSADGNYSHAEGYRAKALGTIAHAEGFESTASGAYSHAEGRDSVASRAMQYAKGINQFSSLGDAQISNFVMKQETIDAIPVVLVSYSGAIQFTGDAINVWTLPTNRVHKFRIDVGARRTDVAGEAAGWEFSGLVARDATGDPYFVGTVEGRAWGTTNAAAWDVTVSIDTTTDVNNPFLAITATGEAGKTIRWVASLNVVEVG